MTLNDHVAEVRKEFKDRFCYVLLTDIPEQYRNAFCEGLEELIVRSITSTAKLTYEAVRPERFDEVDMQSGEFFDFNACLSQLDANWEEFRGEEK